MRIVRFNPISLFSRWLSHSICPWWSATLKMSGCDTVADYQPPATQLILTIEPLIVMVDEALASIRPLALRDRLEPASIFVSTEDLSWISFASSLMSIAGGQRDVLFAGDRDRVLRRVNEDAVLLTLVRYLNRLFACFVVEFDRVAAA
jgi:hypothetical protein